jgi:hypothetical protein
MRIKNKRRLADSRFIILPLLVMALLFTVTDVYGRTMPKRNFKLNKPMAGPPNTINYTHRISNIWFTITNWGFLGSAQDPNMLDPETGEAAPSCEFPAGSDLEYLFQGAIWIGAIVDGDTLVSCGTDGWWDTHEMYADEAGDSTGEIWLGSTRPATAYPRNLTDIYQYQVPESLSVSEEDFISYYADTNVSVAEVDPIDARPLRPLGLQVEQKSYSWSYDYAEDFILFDFKLTNIGVSPIREMWMAFHVDADCHHNQVGSSGAQDDITGFLERSNPIEGIDSLDINTAYIMDNDGDPESGEWDYQSVRSVTGTRVVRIPEGSDSLGFNWWISNINSALDWGPQWLENYRGPFPGGGRGTPGGDAARYRILSNGEFDYDQVRAALNYGAGGTFRHQGREWIDPLPSANAKDLANGYDTRYTYSFGPFEVLNPGDSLKLTIGYIAGEYLHVDPADFDVFNGNEADTNAINEFVRRLDFSDFALNATWAEWVYDNPGVDTDSDGYRGQFDTNYAQRTGDTIWIKGDTIPDFAGPPPPPSPDLTIDTEVNNVRVSWNSRKSENTLDAFGNGLDFEGYRVYRSRTSVLGDFYMLGHFDRIDYDSIYYDSFRGKMVLSRVPPRTLGDLLERADTSATFDFAVSLTPPYQPIRCPTDPVTGQFIFVPHSFNTGCDEYRDYYQDYNGDGTIDSTSEKLTIHSEIYDSTVVVFDTMSTDPLMVDTIDVKYYTFADNGVLASVAWYYSVTSRDYGDPRTGLSPLESSRAVNMQLVYAIDDFANQTGDVYVYPNPYILDGRYRNEGWENISEHPEYSQRIYFANLPAGNSTIRIFTLDGDLVDKIEVSTYPEQPGDDEDIVRITQPVTSWDLISRNTQSIVSGIYLFSIDSDRGRQIGKFVIIK